MSPIVKRKRDKFSIPSKYLLLLLTVVCVILMAVTFLTDFSTLPLNKVAGYVVVPFQKGVSHVGQWISTRVDELGELRVVLQENQELKQQIDELTIQNTQLQQDKYELNNLRELYKLDEQYSGYDKVGARIIAICDSIDAMTSNRRYRKALGFDVCYQEIEKNLGKMYDPIIGQYVLDHFDKVTACLHENVTVKAV